MVSSVANPHRLGRQAVDVIFRADPLGRGRIRRDKSSSPPLLKPSLKVKGNGAHGQSSAYVVAPVSGPQRARSIKGPPQHLGEAAVICPCPRVQTH